MLVEDNIDDAFLTKRILRKAGIGDIRIAEDGREALAILLASGEPLPEMLILDLRLPGVDGLEVYQQLRRQERTRALPVIILSSSEDPKDREKCLNLGAVAYLTKPLELSALQLLLA